MPKAKKQITEPGFSELGKVNDVFIIFNKGDPRVFKNLTIHSGTMEQMEQFIQLFKKVLTKFNITYDLDKLKFKRPLVKDNITDRCDWYNMPEFIQNPAMLNTASFVMKIQRGDKLEPFFADISLLTGRDVLRRCYDWYPSRPNETLNPLTDKMYQSSPTATNKYPIYIISKGRWERRLTSRYLEWSEIPYKIVVEPQEYDKYAEVIDPAKILVLPEKYLNKNQGGIPARNFVLEHSIANGDKRHWILDDNIYKYHRMNLNERPYIKGADAFRIVEDYADRYNNIKMCGHNYYMFGMSPSLNPLIKNTRIYSSILLSNDIIDILGEGWRGRYNEDTDLSLRILKAGYPTILFNSILANKQTTLASKGGNTDSIYAEENALYKKAQSLAEQHPEVARVVERFHRTHHKVDYSPFKNLKPVFNPGVREKLTAEPNNYGMTIVAKEIYAHK